MRLVSLAIIAAGCAADPVGPHPVEWSQPHAVRDDPQPEPPAPTRLHDPVMVRYHMRRHFDDVRRIEQQLLAGKLDDARALATLVAAPINDPGLGNLDVAAGRVIAAARAVGEARGIDDGLRKEVALAVECASCHVAAQRPARFVVAPHLPRDRGTPASRMERHVWAVDRLWEGLVGPDEDRWTRGLGVLADTPLAFPPMTDAPQLALDLQRRARAQLDARPTTLLSDRGAAYGELLVTCAACHATLHVAVH